ncbi:phage baseplate assembly protein V [Phenylobacterium sp.]|uniref:phage baseplate assembly protein V n=1 Tax=Phenylobacterium sp. TaxID=1871053 RepID=UPI00301D1C79
MLDAPTIDPHETERRAFDIARWATVEAREGKRVIVRAGEVLSGPIPWFAFRAGETVIWSPPSKGEQGLLLCPEGEIRLGLFFPGVESTAFPLPEGQAESIRFKDLARLSYDPEAHALDVALPPGGKASIAADVYVAGDLRASGDVVAGDISLRGHPHKDVQPGAGLSGGPMPS